VSSIQTIMNLTNHWTYFYNAEHSEHNRRIGPQSSVSFEWLPWVPWCHSPSEFYHDHGHYMKFYSTTTGGIRRWYMYERWGSLQVFGDGYQDGPSPAGFPIIQADHLIIVIGPDPNAFTAYPEIY
jgi:hypothetical protein